MMGRPIYVIENLINYDTLCCVSSEDDSADYDMENIYDAVPSVPLRFEGKGSIGTPEWVCVDLVSSGTSEITFFGLYCHNLTQLEAVGDELRLKGCVEPCSQSGACDWDNPDREIVLDNTLIANHNNLWVRMKNMNYASYRVDFIDQNNPFAIDIGEMVLGRWLEFSFDCHLQPGRADGPEIYLNIQQTPMGQYWTNFWSFGERLNLTFKNIQNANQVDEIQVFLQDVAANGGFFIWVPDREQPFSYYVLLTNLKDLANRLAYGGGKELREWKLDLVTLTCGRRLL